MCKADNQVLPKQIIPVDDAHHARTLLHQQSIILLALQQFRHGLGSIRLKIDIALLLAERQAIQQIVELAYDYIIRRIGFIHATGTLHVIIIKELGGIVLQFLVHIYFANRLQGFLLLLQVIIIYRRCDGKLRTCVFITGLKIGISKGRFILVYALHSPQGAMPVIIEFLVHGGALIDFHQADISHQTFQFIGRYPIDFPQQAIRPFEIHPDESTKSQMIQRLRLYFRKPLPCFERLMCQGFGQVQVLVTDKIGFMIQRIRLQIGIRVHPSPTRKEDGDDTHAQSQ